MQSSIKRLCLFLLLLIHGGFMLAQTTDSLLNELRLHPDLDTVRVNILLKLQEEYVYNQIDSSFAMGHQALKISQDLKYHQGIAIAYQLLGMGYCTLGKFDKAEEYAHKELKVALQHNLYRRTMDSRTNLAILAMVQGDYVKSKSSFLKALIIADSLQDTSSMADIRINLGEIYFALHDFEQAEENYNLARQFARIDSDPHVEARATFKLGRNFSVWGKYEKANTFLTEGLAMFERINDQLGVVSSLINLGENYLLVDSLDKAASLFQRAQSITTKSQLYSQQRKLEYDYGLLNLAKGKPVEAIEFLEQYLPYAQKSKIKYQVVQTYKYLSDAYLQLGDYKTSLLYKSKAYDLRDSILNKDVIHQLTMLQKEYEVAIREGKIENLMKEKKVNELELASIQFRNVVMTVGLVVAVLAVVLLITGFRIKSHLTNELNEKYEEIKVQNEMIESINIDLQAQALRAQMNPHFIFNSLNSIQYLVVKGDTQRAFKYITIFSRLLRNVLNNSEKRWVTLKEEIETLMFYAELESLRFNDDFNYEIVWPPEVQISTTELIPSMIIQPFVENSIIHGFSKKTGSKKLTIKFGKTNSGQITCQVIDNGIGRSAANHILNNEISIHESKGVRLVEERLKILDNITNSKSNLEIIDLVDKDKAPLGTCVTVAFPKAINMADRSFIEDLKFTKN